MPISTGNLLRHAYEHHYAVPAFSVHTADMIDAVLAEAETVQMPVLLQIGQRAIRNGQMEPLANHIRAAAAGLRIPVGIHLDHSRAFSQVVQALRAGFTSCMLDASAEPFDENVRQTCEVVRVCRVVGVPVEGELGAIGGVEDDIEVADAEVSYTTVESAVAFVAQTEVDALAVAIGSAHGMYKRDPRLDLARLEAIYNATDVPLVLHGGSGIPAAQIRSALKYGIAKINFDTELRLAFVAGLAAGAKAYPDDPFAATELAKQKLRETVREKIGLCRAD